MKKITFILFTLFIGISTASAATTVPVPATTGGTATGFAPGSVEATLSLLMANNPGMTLEQAVLAFIARGGNQTAALTAALAINPQFVFTAPTGTTVNNTVGTDPTQKLPAPAAGPSTKTTGLTTGLTTGRTGIGGSGGNGSGGGTVSP